ncbi:chorismate-binding protein [Sphingomicrobium clamense]|uniref:anthranilate synthase n=1 Tax=Sphingomicrobium clamense TaxID=2851013 RepID=A0ABS6V448_9SPHN|nr:chorismate-binding protein [Sphingomicrobium sp. B8]MBW0143977.1 chorismate-binding protein [Sphingomicrobium sp. B8]
MSKLAHLEIGCLTRRLPGAHDPVTLHAALTARGGMAPMLFRRTGGRALILVDAALRLEAKGEATTMTALSESGRLLADRIALACRSALSDVMGDVTQFAFPRCDDPDEEKRMADPGALALLRAAASLPASGDTHALTLMGILGFDHVDMVEALPAAAETDFPDLLVHLAQTLVVVEPSGAARVLALTVGHEDADVANRQQSLAAERLSKLTAVIDTAVAPAVADAEGGEATTDVDDGAFVQIVEQLKENIAAGDIFQAVPSRSFTAPCADPLSAFRRLVAADPSAFHFYAKTDHGTLFGASPETAIELTPDETGTTLAVCPIAGTRPRGATPDADDRQEADLRLDSKETAEHMMLVDLARNDVARVSAPGSRRVAKLLTVERFAKVMHLVSRVEGRLDEGRDAIDAIRACLNVGTLSGAPKLKAIELIRGVETSARGPYGGAIFALTGDGAMDSAVVIRSAMVDRGVATVRAGAGVVADSDPQAEAAETRAKALAMLSALGAAA